MFLIPEDAIDIPGWEGLYKVTSCGRFFSYKTYNNPTKEWKENLPWTNWAGYLCVDFKLTVKEVTKKERWKVHRLLYTLFVGPIPDGMQVDHINRVRTDNRYDNLRLATIGENACNAGKRKQNASSNYKGVCYFKRTKQWTAAIVYRGKKYNLGYFNTEVEAAVAYDLKAIELHKDFASTNLLKTADMLEKEKAWH